MPDLERSSVVGWLRQAEPRVASLCGPPVYPIEDGTGAAPLLAELGAALDGAAERGGTAAALLADDGGATARAVLAQLGPARLLRLFAWLGDAEAGAASDRLGAALLRGDEGGGGGTARDVLLALHRREFLARIFAPDRLRDLAEALGPAPAEAGGTA